MRRPPLVVVFVGLVIIALGETAGALMSQLRPQITSYARARVAANPQTHGLAGSAEYDAEVTARAVYAAEAGLSFFHTHAQGLGPLVIFAGTVAASTVPWRLARGAVAALLGLRERAWQSLYHFTAGGAVDDVRLTTLPAYPFARPSIKGPT